MRFVYFTESARQRFTILRIRSDEVRLAEYDELWPIRWARRVVYGIDPPPEEKVYFPSTRVMLR